MYKIFTQKIFMPLACNGVALYRSAEGLTLFDKNQTRKWLMRAMLTSFTLLIALMQVSATGLAQKVTINQQETTLKALFKAINEQTGYSVFWSPQVVKGSQRVKADFKDMPLEEVLKRSLAGLPLIYSVEDKAIVIKEREQSFLSSLVSNFFNTDVRGKVIDEKGQPLVGAFVEVKGGKRVTTDAEGKFFLQAVDDKAVVMVSYIGYVSKELPVRNDMGSIVLLLSLSALDEVQVIAYGTTSRRLTTGNQTRIKGEDIANQPINNPIAALQNLVPGLIVTQDNGVPGSAVKVQIRGRTKVDPTFGADDSPLFIIDGVPMASGNENLNMLTSAISSTGTSGLSPFSTVSPGDIESIEVLKDADATSIYGSRGANGVILITTKKGKAGPTTISAKVGSGFSKAVIPQMLNTQQYIAMRKEAFRNDNLTMSLANAADLMLWDTTRTTNLAKELIGGTASFTNAEASVSGGTEQIQYAVRSTYSRETNVYPKPMPNTRASFYGNLTGKAFDKKLTFNFVGSYTQGKNKTTGSDLSLKLSLPPHFKLYNEDGSIAWNEGGVRITGMDNPLAYLEQSYTATSGNLNGNMLLNYAIDHHFSVKTSVGYNSIITDELRNSPKSSVNPLEATITNTSQFGHSEFESLIVEPQAEYKRGFGSHHLNVLIGGTLQSQERDGYNFTLRDYSSDALLGTLFGVSSSSFVNPSSVSNEYKYAGVFGRATYNYQDTYILNISGRRDGSSRFGTNYRYTTFGAAGGAWIFSNLDLFKDSKVLSFGKLRASYGTTGNDKIGDYQYMALYSSSVFSPTYKDSLALSPESFFKPDLHWEKSKKLEFAIELGFLKDKVLLSASWYRNNSSDPLVQYPLPNATGFASVTANLNNVVVQNAGWELTLSSTNVQKKDVSWKSSFNLSLPNNKLLKYPGLAQSSYANKYLIGRSLDVVYIGEFLGVDPKTGLYQVKDLNGTGKLEISNTGDLSPGFDSEPSFYGGLTNDFRYKSFGLSVFFGFTKQYLVNWMAALQEAPVGNMYNVPVNALKRWQNDGDKTEVQKFTTRAQASTDLTGQRAAFYSDAKYDNIFYLRLRNVNLTYNLPTAFAGKFGMKSAGLYVQAQNLFTISPFSSTDPETRFITRLAPLRTCLLGIQISL